MKKSNFEGIDGLLEQLNKISTGAGKLDGQSLPITELFSPRFMQENTPLPNIHAWFDAAGLSINSWDDVDANMGKLDAFTVETTVFPSWNDMKEKAVADYVFTSMGF